MGGNSTLHSTVSSDSVTPQEKFDLKSWQGLTELLKAGKDALKPEAYAEFRNLVLQYAQHGGDLEYKKRIDDMVATFGRAPIVPAETLVPEPVVEKTPAPQPMQNARRIAPRFGDTPVVLSALPVEEVTPVPEQAPVQAPTPVEVPLVVEQEEVPMAEPVIEMSVLPEPEPTPVIPAPEPEIPLPPVPEPAITLPQSAPVEVSKVPEPVSPPEPEVSQGEQVPFMTLEQCKVRIAEIKRAVNSHFGNPVALMAVPNNLGKVYMTALLSALKAATPGAPGGVSGAMAELERAYKALMEGDMVAPSTTPPQTPEPVSETELPPTPPVPDTPALPVPEPVPEPKSEHESVSTDLIATPIPESIAEVPLPPVSEPAPEPEPSPTSPVPDIPVPPVSEPAFTPAPEAVSVVESTPDSLTEKEVKRMSILERIESEQGLPPLMDRENPEVSRAEVMHSAFEKTDNTISAVVGTVNKKLNPLPHSIADLVTEGVSGYETWAKDAEIESPDKSGVKGTDPIAIRENKWTKKGMGEENKKEALEQQGISTEEVVVKQTELFSPQISSALDTLLHEWSIFGGSGFFGMGPGGTEHPLFKKLSTLSMGEVVAGRFDGADPKAIKVIKQYVDAWRHEQGITYTPTETFEHYLRRVVQRIMKRQST